MAFIQKADKLKLNEFIGQNYVMKMQGDLIHKLTTFYNVTCMK